jgi:hypothetical protein
LDVERFLTRQTQARDAFAGLELQRKHTHADQVGAMDALETFRDHGPHAEQRDALRGPIAGGAGAVFLAGQDQERDAFGLIFHRRVVDEHRLAIGEVAREGTFGFGGELVAEAYVGQGAADHYLMIAATGTVAVEVPAARPVPSDTVRRPPRMEPAARCDRCDGIAERASTRSL